MYSFRDITDAFVKYWDINKRYVDCNRSDASEFYEAGYIKGFDDGFKYAFNGNISKVPAILKKNEPKE